MPGQFHTSNPQQRKSSRKKKRIIDDISQLQSANTTSGLNYMPFDKNDSMPSSTAHSGISNYKARIKKKGKEQKAMRPVQKLLKSLDKNYWFDKPNPFEEHSINFFQNVSPMNPKLLDDKSSKTPT